MIVAGALQRDGKLRVEGVPDVTREPLHVFIGRAIKDEAEVVYTDEFRAYQGIKDSDTRHETVNHSEEVWAVGDIHTNGIEGVWWLFKRSITGSFHRMSAKHMDCYLEELEWQFNNRHNKRTFRDRLARIVRTGPKTYQELVDG